MTTLRVRATVDPDGRLRLDVPTQLPAGEVDAVIMVDAPDNGKPTPPRYDMTDLAGKLKWQGDALSEQRRLRDEW